MLTSDPIISIWSSTMGGKTIGVQILRSKKKKLVLGLRKYVKKVGEEEEEQKWRE